MESDDLKRQVIVAMNKLRGAFVANQEYQSRLTEAQDLLKTMDWESQSLHVGYALQQAIKAGQCVIPDSLVLAEARDEMKLYLERL